MNHIFDLVVLDHTYLQQVSGLIRADQHREANLIVSRHTTDRIINRMSKSSSEIPCLRALDNISS